ncbi:MAG: Hint domain-containing protein [Sulfitobacter sp.]
MATSYLSEINYRDGEAEDFIEVVVDAGTDVSNIQILVYHPSGKITSISPLDEVYATIAGHDVYVIDKGETDSFEGIHHNGAVALVVDGEVLQFLSFGKSLTAKEGPAAGMTSTGIGTSGSGQSLETSDQGGSYAAQSDKNAGTIPCFLAGTLIRTPQGDLPVETLRAGDLVLTQDGGSQPILWQGHVEMRGVHPAARPICIPAHSFGIGAPLRDLYLSPNHAVALNHWRCDLMFGQPELLIAAKNLCGHRGIRAAAPRQTLRYHHLLLPQHHLIFANGLPSESLYPGALDTLALGPGSAAQIREVLAGQGAYGPPVRQRLRRFEAEALIGALRSDTARAA